MFLTFKDEKKLTEHHYLTIIRRHLVNRPLKINKVELSHLASLFIRRVNFAGKKNLNFSLSILFLVLQSYLKIALFNFKLLTFT